MQNRRFRWPARSDTPDYDLAEESFSVYVPAPYTGEEAYGLYVWVSPFPRGRIASAWMAVMDKHKLIWIAAINTGNNRTIQHRLGLPLDAVHNMQKQYEIDPERIYIASGSGGGRCSSRLGLVYADVFHGAMPIIGCDYFRNIPVPNQPDEMWRAHFARPAAHLLRIA